MLDLKAVSAIGRKIADIAVADISRLPVDYATLDKAVRDTIAAFDGVKTDVRLDLSERSLSKLRISLILSDITSVFLETTRTRTTLTPAAPASAPVDLLIRAEWINDLGILWDDQGRARMSAVYVQRSDTDAQAFARSVQHLMDDGRILLRPLPVVIAHTREKGQLLFDIEPNTPGNTWMCSDALRAGASVPLDMCSDDQAGLIDQAEPFMMPFLDGISFELLGKVLSDERDSLTSFRLAAKQAVAVAREKRQTSAEILSDVVRPAIDTLNRRFKQLTSMHAMKVGGVAVGCAALSLLAYNGVPNAWIGAAGAVPLLGKELADRSRDLESLRDSPWYLLWKARSAT